METVLPGAIKRLLSATQHADPCILVCNCINDSIIMYGTQIVAIAPLALDASVHEVSETIALTTGKQILVYSLDSRGVCRVSQTIDIACTKLSFVSRSLLALCDNDAVRVYNLETERIQAEYTQDSQINNVRGKNSHNSSDSLQFVTSGEKTLVWSVLKTELKFTELPTSSVSAWFMNDLLVTKTRSEDGAWYIWAGNQLVGSVLSNSQTMLFQSKKTNFLYSNGTKFAEGSTENIASFNSNKSTDNLETHAGISEFASLANTFAVDNAKNSLTIYSADNKRVLQGFNPAIQAFVSTSCYLVVGGNMFTQDFKLVDEFKNILFAAEDGNQIVLIEQGGNSVKVLGDKVDKVSLNDIKLDEITGLSCHNGIYISTKESVYILSKNAKIDLPKQIKSSSLTSQYLYGVYSNELWIYDLTKAESEAVSRNPDYKLSLPSDTTARIIGNLVFLITTTKISVYELSATSTVDLLTIDVAGVVDIAYNGTLLALLTSDHLEIFLKVPRVRNSFIKLQSMNTDMFNEYSPTRVSLQGLNVLLASDTRVWKTKLDSKTVAEEYNLDTVDVDNLVETLQTVPENAPGILECYISALLPVKVDLNFDTAGLSPAEIAKTREIMQFLSTAEHLDAAGVAALYFTSAKSWSYAQLSKTQPDLKQVEEEKAKEKEEPTETNDPTVESKPVCILPWLPVSELKEQIEQRAKDLFARTRDPTAVSLEYLALKKKSVLLALWRVASHPEKTKTLNLLKNDFHIDRWKVTAQKNAYALMSKRRSLYAAAFFLLGGNIKDSVQILLERLHNLPLAVAIARVYDGDHGSGMQFLRTRIEGSINIWFSFFALWVSGQCLDAMQILAKSEDIHANLLASRYLKSAETEAKLKRLGVTTPSLLTLPLIETVTNAPIFSKPEPVVKPKEVEQPAKPKRATAFDAFFAEDKPEQKSVPLEPDMSAFDAFKPQKENKEEAKAEIQLEPNMDAFAAFKPQKENKEETKAESIQLEPNMDAFAAFNEPKEPVKDRTTNETNANEEKVEDDDKSTFSKPRVAAPANIQLEPDMSAFGF